MKLAAWLDREHITQDEFAVRIGTSQAAVARYARGQRMPKKEQMAAIVRETNGLVTSADFYGEVGEKMPAVVADAVSA